MVIVKATVPLRATVLEAAALASDMSGPTPGAAGGGGGGGGGGGAESSFVIVGPCRRRWSFCDDS
jgi:hypothetical protein